MRLLAMIFFFFFFSSITVLTHLLLYIWILLLCTRTYIFKLCHAGTGAVRGAATSWIWRNDTTGQRRTKIKLSFNTKQVEKSRDTVPLFFILKIEKFIYTFVLQWEEVAWTDQKNVSGMPYYEIYFVFNAMLRIWIRSLPRTFWAGSGSHLVSFCTVLTVQFNLNVNNFQIHLCTLFLLSSYHLLKQKLLKVFYRSNK